MPRVHIELDKRAVIAPVRHRTFGAFVEHLGRCVYTGLYEPGHPTANEDGFRMDVVELVQELGTATVRYPGGNFVSGFRWEDSVGPRDKRPVRRDLAWHSLEPNQVGLDEFARWLKLTGAELMLAVNLGTRGILPALDLLEYANHPSGTALSDLRIANGTPQPHNVRMWCLGNEMDGSWQQGFMTADDYGKLAARTAAAMRMADRNLELVVCGSSGSSLRPSATGSARYSSIATSTLTTCRATRTTRSWTVTSAPSSPRRSTWNSSSAQSPQLQTTSGTRSARRRRCSSPSMSGMSGISRTTRRPPRSATSGPTRRALLEDVYTVADAVVVGNLLMTLLKHSDRVTSASLAQLVNVIAPIMTEPGGPAWRQTTFFPFAITSRLASGEVIRPVIEGRRTARRATARPPSSTPSRPSTTAAPPCSSSTATSKRPRG